jgi:hypothetical protein
MNPKPVALEAYAASIDTKPHNAYLERSATLCLLPACACLPYVPSGLFGTPP